MGKKTGKLMSEMTDQEYALRVFTKKQQREMSKAERDRLTEVAKRERQELERMTGGKLSKW